MRPLLLCLLLCSCAHAPTRPVTAGARSSLSAATGASNEAVEASKRSSGHIAEFKQDAAGFRTDAARIRGDAKEVLKLLNR